MRVIGVEEFGPPEVLREFEVPEPHAGPGEIRIAVRAAAVNPTDTLLRSGARADALRELPTPHVPGMDAAGVVDEVGAGVERFAVGDAVMAIVLPRSTHGGYAEYIVVPEASAVVVPAGATFAEAASIPMNGLTAQLALDLLDLPTGATIGVTGAAGAFGGAVVQLAKVRGLRVIADASEADEELVRALGADVVVRRGDDVAARMRAVVPDGVDALADGSLQAPAVLDAIRDGGGLATVRGWAEPCPRGITAHPVWVRDYVTATESLDELRVLAEWGALSMRVAEEIPVIDAARAHRLLDASGRRGRFVLVR
jgi:NADPH:quinone reductase